MVCSAAAAGSSPRIPKWARVDDCPRDVVIGFHCGNAAMSGPVDILCAKGPRTII